MSATTVSPFVEHENKTNNICFEDEFFNNNTQHGTKKNSESPTGIEPMASQIPVGRSNQLSYKRLVVSWAILLGLYVTRVLHTARISNVEIIKFVVNNKDGKF